MTVVSLVQLPLINDKSTLVQVMAWCRQATSHYLNQCWPSSMLPYGITRPQWVNSFIVPWQTWKNSHKILKLTYHVLEVKCHVFASTSNVFLINLHWVQYHGLESNLVQVMAWWHQATSHCLNHCWPTSMSPNGITRGGWWVKTIFSIEVIIKIFIMGIPILKIHISYKEPGPTWIQSYIKPTSHAKK